MNTITFIITNWDWLLLIAVMIVGVILRLKSLWKGNVIEWLVALCADAEAVYGGGTGYIKLRYVYNAFLETFPALSKYVSFEMFSKWVDIALDKLKSKISTNEQLSKLIKPVEGGTDNVEQ